jgi:SET domain-containing protein
MTKEVKADGCDPYYALFKSASFLNHSCKPNAYRSFFREDSSVLFVKAVRDIDLDEEVTVSYVNSLFDFEARQEALRELYQFECKCERCIFESEHLGYLSDFN